MADISEKWLGDCHPTISRQGETASLTVYPRLHMFSLDLSLREDGMRSGSMTTTINMPIEVSVSSVLDNIDQIHTVYSGDETIKSRLDKLRHSLGVKTGWSVDVKMPETLRAHTGLGTSTQILGGVLLCAAETVGVKLGYKDLFKMGLGRASMAGLSLLYSPGFIIEDGYKKSDSSNGDVLHPWLYDFPEEPSGKLRHISGCPWSVVIGMKNSGNSLCSKQEESFWQKNLPIPKTEADCTLQAVKNNILPALRANDFDLFLRGMRTATSDSSKTAERKIQPKSTKTALKELEMQFGMAAVSSLGPTIYAFSPMADVEQLDCLSTDEYTFTHVPLGETL